MTDFRSRCKWDGLVVLEHGHKIFDTPATKKWNLRPLPLNYPTKYSNTDKTRS